MAISFALGEHLEKLMDDLVARGRYGSKSEVLREGLRLVEEREKKPGRLEAELAIGLADIRAGRVIPAEEVFDRLANRYQAIAVERGE